MNWKSNAKRHESYSKRYLDYAEERFSLVLKGGLYQPASGQTHTAPNEDPYPEVQTQRPEGTVADWIIAVAAILGLIVSGLTLVGLALTVAFSMKQWAEANRNAKAAEISAFAAEQSVHKSQLAIDQGRTQFIQDQRPYIWHYLLTRDTSVPNRLGLKSYWANYGHSPAQRFSTAGKMFCGKDAVEKAYGYLDNLKKHPKWESKNVPLAPFVPSGDPPKWMAYDTFTTDDLDAASFADCSLTLPLVTVAAMEYYDSSGTRYYGEFCNGLRIATIRGYLADGSCLKHNSM